MSSFYEKEPRTHKRRGRHQESATSTSERVLALVGDRLAATKPEDNFDIVGRNVAAKLREISKDQAIFAERLINEVLFEAQLGTLNRQTQIATYDFAQNIHQNSGWQQPSASLFFNNFNPNSNI
jgi:hypothetical protein